MNRYSTATAAIIASGAHSLHIARPFPNPARRDRRALVSYTQPNGERREPPPHDAPPPGAPDPAVFAPKREMPNLAAFSPQAGQRSVDTSSDRRLYASNTR